MRVPPLSRAPLVFLPVAAALGLLQTTLALAGDRWPQFRGPTQQGISEAKGLPLTWSETENIRWKTALPGEGWSSPVVAEGRIWMTTATDEGRSLRALCVDLETGKLIHDVEVFKVDVAPPKHRRNSYASPTPLIDGGKVFVHFGTLGTAALDERTGQKIWENRDLKVDHQNGPGGSISHFGDKIIIPCDGMDAQYEVALEKSSGRAAWRTERSAIPKLAKRPPDMRKAYGTTVVLENGSAPVSVTTAAERVYGYDPATGRERWYVDIPGFSNVPLPVWNKEAMYISTGFGKPELWAIKLGGLTGDGTGSHILWKQKAGAPAQSSPVLVGNRLYMVTDGGIASCLDTADGRIVWKERIGSDFAASPIFADGRIYFFDCSGNATVIAPGDEYKVLAKNQLESGFMASAAIVGKAFILRTKTHLYRVEAP